MFLIGARGASSKKEIKIKCSLRGIGSGETSVRRRERFASHAMASMINTGHDSHKRGTWIMRTRKHEVFLCAMYVTRRWKRNRGPRGRAILNNFTLEKEMNSLFIILFLSFSHPPLSPRASPLVRFIRALQPSQRNPARSYPFPHHTPCHLPRARQAGCSFI